VTNPSLHPNVSSSLDNNDASPFVGPSLHLHTSFKGVKPFFQSKGAKKSKIADKISSRLDDLMREGVKIVLVVK
jgi:hypothetical protein